MPTSDEILTAFADALYGFQAPPEPAVPAEEEVLAWKSVAPDLTSWYDRRTLWLPNTEVESPGEPGGPCPATDGDGLCLAQDFAGAASAAGPTISTVLVAYRPSEVLGGDDHKVRVNRCRVLSILDVSKLIREGAFQGADLQAADLRGADLRGADLRDADLWGANLRGAD